MLDDQIHVPFDKTSFDDQFARLRRQRAAGGRRRETGTGIPSRGESSRNDTVPGSRCPIERDLVGESMVDHGLGLAAILHVDPVAVHGRGDDVDRFPCIAAIPRISASGSRSRRDELRDLVEHRSGRGPAG